MNSNSACCASLLEVLCTTLALSCASRPKPRLALSPAAPDSLITCGVIEARSVGFEPSRFGLVRQQDRKSTRLNSSHGYISYAVFCLKKKKQPHIQRRSKLPPLVQRP